MILALCSSGRELNSDLDARFGRTAYFLFFDTENSEFTVLENSAKDAKGGAGAMAVQLLLDHDTKILIAPEVGPQALEALEKFKILSYQQGSAKTVQNAITAWKNSELQLIEKAGNKGLHKA